MTSAIGLATNATLDPNDPAYHWSDQGAVVRTKKVTTTTRSIPPYFKTLMAACG